MKTAIGKFVIAAAVPLALAPVLAGPPASAAVVTSCQPHYHAMLGRYLFENDAWAATVCISAGTPEVTSWQVTSSTASSGESAAAAWPHITLGCYYTVCTTGVLPRQLSRLSALRSWWHFRPPSSGIWDAAYDLWVTRTSTMTTGPGGISGAEVMVWPAYHRARVRFTSVHRVSIGGRRWLEYTWFRTAHGSTWRCIVFRKVYQVHGFGRRGIGMLPFLHWAQRRGYIRGWWHVQGVTAGVSLRTGGAGFASASFAVSATAS